MSLYEEYRQNGKWVDFVIVVDGRRFPVHKIVLAARNPVFKAMLESDMIEAQRNEVVLSDINPDLFDEFLRFIYTQELPLKTYPHLVGILTLSSRFQDDRLFSCCVQRLKETLNETSAAEMLLLSNLYNLKDLEFPALKAIYKNVEGQSRFPAWKELSSNVDNMIPILEFFKIFSYQPVFIEDYSYSGSGGLGDKVDLIIPWHVVCFYEKVRCPLFDIKAFGVTHRLFLDCHKRSMTSNRTVFSFYIKCVNDDPTIMISFECLAHCPLYGESMSCLNFALKYPTLILQFEAIDALFNVGFFKLSIEISKGACWRLNVHPLGNIPEIDDITVRPKNGPEFPLNKALLAKRSPYFQALFQSSPSKTKFVLNDVTEKTFRTILNFVCLDGLLIMEQVDVTLMKAALMLGLKDLFAVSCDIMQGQITLDNAVDLLLISHNENVEDLRQVVQLFIFHRLSNIKMDKWKNLKDSPHVLNRFLIEFSKYCMYIKNCKMNSVRSVL